MALRAASLVLLLLSGCFPVFIGAHCDTDADCVPAEACVANHCATRSGTGGGSAFVVFSLAPDPILGTKASMISVPA